MYNTGINIELPSVQLVKRFEKFSCNVNLLVDYIDCVNQLNIMCV